MSLPAVASFSGDFVAKSKFSEPLSLKVEPVGQYFLAHATRTLQDRTWSEYEQIKADKAAAEKKDEKSDEDEFEEVTDEDLLEHDPKDWKTVDMYAALGLGKFRSAATRDQIDRAYRKSVLTFHPDKQGEKSGFQDGFFKIIQKAYEVLTNDEKRRQFDSVDKAAEVAVPDKKGKYDFYAAWAPVFAAEGRFSKKQPVPVLGDSAASKEYVESFYKFWNNFDSWRSFEFLDEDVPDDTSNRDHKRYIEKKNNSARRKRKTEDNKRVSEFVRRAHQEDPRIKAFKQAEKDEKAKRKWDREAGARKAAQEAKDKAEAEQKAKEEAAKNAAAAQAEHKKSKAAEKTAKKKSKRTIRAAVKDSGYFGDAGKSLVIDSDVELLLAEWDVDTLVDVAAKITPDNAKDVLTAAAKGKNVQYLK